MIVLPIVLLTVVVAVVFQERWREDASGRFLHRIGRDLMVLRQLNDNAAQQTAAILEIGMQRYGSHVPPLPASCRLPQRPDAPANLVRTALAQAAEEPLKVCAPPDAERWQVRLTTAPVIDFFVPTRFFLTSKWHFLPVWTGIAALLLSIVSVLFLKNQVRPITQLAAAADAFGRGDDDVTFRPAGALEVRQASLAFMRMRLRIKRHLHERSLMLAAISHDLRTMLTRLLLAMALLPKDDAHNALNEDLQLMRRILDSYLQFAESHYSAPPEMTAIVPLVQSVISRYANTTLCAVPEPIEALILPLRADAMRRALHNVLNNALKWGTRAQITLGSTDGNMLCLYIDDDGTGIAASDYDAVLQPFYRSNTARTLESDNGLGLGLAVVRDVMRAHGGTVRLMPSPLGGLRVQLLLAL